VFDSVYDSVYEYDALAQEAGQCVQLVARHLRTSNHVETSEGSEAGLYLQVVVRNLVTKPHV
jgi:hypothetical protein